MGVVSAFSGGDDEADKLTKQGTGDKSTSGYIDLTRPQNGISTGAKPIALSRADLCNCTRGWENLKPIGSTKMDIERTQAIIEGHQSLPDQTVAEDDPETSKTQRHITKHTSRRSRIRPRITRAERENSGATSRM